MTESVIVGMPTSLAGVRARLTALWGGGGRDASRPKRLCRLCAHGASASAPHSVELPQKLR